VEFALLSPALRRFKPGSRLVLGKRDRAARRWGRLVQLDLRLNLAQLRSQDSGGFRSSLFSS
jgi:hypothetical protein